MIKQSYNLVELDQLSFEITSSENDKTFQKLSKKTPLFLTTLGPFTHF